MKPGDLVRTVFNSYRLKGELGLVVEVKDKESFMYPIVVLSRGELYHFGAYELEIVNEGAAEYDGCKEKERLCL